jgi:hypothetical protein
VVFAVALLAALGAIGWLAAQGWSYYSTPLIERPRHPGYWTFKPGGTLGCAYGMAGSALMVAMLVYSLRKRVKALKGLGRLRAWLSFHIFCGLVGPLLIILHSSFKVRGLVALSFWSMIAVALSGVLGRYLYLQLPRTRAGDELTLTELGQMEDRLNRRLTEEVGLAPELVERLEALGRRGVPGPETPLAVLLLRLPFDGLALRWRLAAFGRRLRGVPRPLRRRALRLARRRAVLTRRIELLARLQQLFHYWHVFHKPFAVVMYLFMVLHIAVVSLAGYGWGWGRGGGG